MLPIGCFRMCHFQVLLVFICFSIFYIGEYRTHLCKENEILWGWFSMMLIRSSRLMKGLSTCAFHSSLGDHLCPPQSGRKSCRGFYDIIALRFHWSELCHITSPNSMGSWDSLAFCPQRRKCVWRNSQQCLSVLWKNLYKIRNASIMGIQ